MPYELRKNGDSVSVCKKGGKVMHTYKGKNALARAKAYMRALYAHTKGEK